MVPISFHAFYDLLETSNKPVITHAMPNYVLIRVIDGPSAACLRDQGRNRVDISTFIVEQDPAS